MSTLILPCLGRKFVNHIPQYLVRHPNGKMLIERSIEGVFAEDYTRILIVLLKKDIQEFDAEEKIIEEIGKKYPIEIVSLDEMTSGPAETVYQAIKKTNVTGRVVVKDSDNYIKLSQQMTGNFVVGLDLNDWEKDIRNLRNKSYLILNEQKYILDIIEKQIKSDIICLGLYGFEQAEKYVQTYEKLSDGTYPICGLYVSHIISYIIGYTGRVFRYVAAEAYENWGDERLWRDLQRDYTMYFIDLDNILGVRGVLTEGSRNKLFTLQNRGAFFVGYTTYDEGYKVSALQTLEEAGLRFIKIVYGCPHSLIKEIIETDEMLERKVIEL